MEKIQLTQKQADAIEYALNKTDDYKDDKDRLLRDISRDYVNFHNDLFPLNKIDIAVAAKALYVGYEVIPQFKVGDWVIFEYKAVRVIGEILEIETDEFFTAKVDDPKYQVPQNIALSKLRHVIPEEIQQEKKRRFWEKLGREVYEYEEGDIVGVEGSKFITYISYEDLDRGEVEFPRFTAGDNEYFPLNKIRLVTPVEKRLDK